MTPDNLPAPLFEMEDGEGYVDLVGDALVTLHTRLDGSDATALFTELNGIKGLFGDDQAWTLTDAWAFLTAAIDFVGIWES